MTIVEFLSARLDEREELALRKRRLFALASIKVDRQELARHADEGEASIILRLAASAYIEHPLFRTEWMP